PLNPTGIPILMTSSPKTAVLLRNTPVSKAPTDNRIVFRVMVASLNEYFGSGFRTLADVPVRLVASFVLLASIAFSRPCVIAIAMPSGSSAIT
ncbi:MAG: hypothetical protein ABL878_16030, partial [Burkholderiales bacterium]